MTRELCLARGVGILVPIVGHWARQVKRDLPSNYAPLVEQSMMGVKPQSTIVFPTCDSRYLGLWIAGYQAQASRYNVHRSCDFLVVILLRKLLLSKILYF